ncbi:MAG: tRNA epoxyqueuosine(34) reductase QueG [Polyangiaceae bacterium]
MHEGRSIDQERDDRARLDQRIRQQARALGFDVVAVARADEPIDTDHRRYQEFVAAGMHGDMAFLADQAASRRSLDCEDILIGARSVVCLGKRYARPDDGADGIVPLIARYARGRDYHNFVKKRLRKLAVFVRHLTPGAEARALCDTEPLLERAWSARAGLGFVGKNGMVITPGMGSYVMLGEVVTNLELVPDTPIAERCGSCTRCLDACPTQAFPRPFVLDARKCISYLTIEASGAPAEELRAPSAEHLFGCDVCQEVCPFNRTAPPPIERTRDFAPLEEHRARTLTDVVTMDEATWDAATLGTPLRRPKRAGLARNAALVAANRARAGAATEDDRRCLEAASAHEDAAVREVAAWGLAAARDGDTKDT